MDKNIDVSQTSMFLPVTNFHRPDLRVKYLISIDQLVFSVFQRSSDPSPNIRRNQCYTMLVYVPRPFLSIYRTTLYWNKMYCLPNPKIFQESLLTRLKLFQQYMCMRIFVLWIMNGTIVLCLLFVNSNAM